VRGFTGGRNVLFRVASLMCVLAIWGCSTHQKQATVPPSAAPIPSSKVYSQDARGLEQQYVPFMMAYAENDPAAMEKSFALFALPKPPEWFGRYFPKTRFNNWYGITRPKSIITEPFSPE